MNWGDGNSITQLVSRFNKFMLEGNAKDLTADEIAALQNVEKIVELVYGKRFSDHFILPQTLYKGVKGALIRGKREEAIQRLSEIVHHLELMETESPEKSPLVLEKQIASMYLTFLIFSISNQAIWLYEKVERGFSIDDEILRNETEPELSALWAKIKKLMDSDGGQLKHDALTHHPYFQ